MPMMEPSTNTDMPENENTTPTPANEKAEERLQAAACSACGKHPKLSKTAIEGVMQLSHLCDHGSESSFGEFASESELIALWNHQQNADVEARRP